MQRNEKGSTEEIKCRVCPVNVWYNCETQVEMQKMKKLPPLKTIVVVKGVIRRVVARNKTEKDMVWFHVGSGRGRR